MKIPLFRWMIDSPLTHLLIVKGLEHSNYGVDVDSKILIELLKELSKAAKEYQGLELICVESAEGDLVKIVL